jgi:hypothetical protein
MAWSASSAREVGTAMPSLLAKNPRYRSLRPSSIVGSLRRNMVIDGILPCSAYNFGSTARSRARAKSAIAKSSTRNATVAITFESSNDFHEIKSANAANAGAAAIIAGNSAGILRWETGWRTRIHFYRHCQDLGFPSSRPLRITAPRTTRLPMATCVLGPMCFGFEPAAQRDIRGRRFKPWTRVSGYARIAPKPLTNEYSLAPPSQTFGHLGFRFGLLGIVAPVYRFLDGPRFNA